MTRRSVAEPATSTLTLEPNAQAPGRARRFVAEQLAQPGDEPLSEVGQLLVSELVTNAVVHAASAVVVEVDVDGSRVQVRVRDADTGPLVGRAGGGTELDEGGRGFLLVDRLPRQPGAGTRGARRAGAC